MFQTITNAIGYTVAYVKGGSVHSKLFSKNQLDDVNEACKKLEGLHIQFAVYATGNNDNNYEYFFASGKIIDLCKIPQNCRNKIERYLQLRDDPIHVIEEFNDFYRVIVAVERPRYFLVGKKDATVCGHYLVANND